MLTLITPTRERSRAFGLLEKYMQRQSYTGALQWLVINDGAEPYRYNMGQQVIIRDKSKDDPATHSIAYNYLAALPHITGNKVLCVEDDDWYSADYLQVMDAALDRADLVGVAPALYYHILARKWRDMKNYEHCSLAATGFTRAVLPTFEQAWRMKGMVYADLFLWAHWKGTLERSALLLPNDERKPSHIGIKGLPWGCRGIGLGHDPTMGVRDGRFAKLKAWLGPDAASYCE